MIDVRFQAARSSVESAGVALMALRGKKTIGRESHGGQLKTAIDAAAEGWILGYLRSLFPADKFLSEEEFESGDKSWTHPDAYWTIDALDGTRSFVEGYDGFCVQVSYVQEGLAQFGVIYEPVQRVTYWALRGEGAYREIDGGERRRLQLDAFAGWPAKPIFVDSTPPQGQVGRLTDEVQGRHLECGSIGLKICRVAEGTAHVFAKSLTFKLWDSAPGELILIEAGGRLGLWSGRPIAYGGNQVYYKNILAAPNGLFELAADALSQGTPADA